jgi:hypothetical protein
MAWFAFLRPLFRVLLKAIEKMLQRAVGHEDSSELDGGLIGAC